MSGNNKAPFKNQDQANKSRVDAPAEKPTNKSMDRGLQDKDRIQQDQKAYK